MLAVTNAVGSQATREADGVLFTRAGIEMGVAATKTFVAQVVLLYALALHLAAARGALSAARLAELQSELETAAGADRPRRRSVDDARRELAERLAWSPFFLYLGRLSGLPVAMEGALKLKEISYVPTDAYAAGEMKHGPIAMLSPETPVVCVATEQGVLPKLLSNLSEVRARGARVLAVATEGAQQIADYAEHVFYVPRTDPLLQVVLGDRPAAAVRLPPGTRARAQRRSAAQPCQDRHRRVVRSSLWAAVRGSRACCGPCAAEDCRLTVIVSVAFGPRSESDDAAPGPAVEDLRRSLEALAADEVRCGARSGVR